MLHTTILCFGRFSIFILECLIELNTVNRSCDLASSLHTKYYCKLYKYFLIRKSENETHLSLFSNPESPALFDSLHFSVLQYVACKSMAK